MIIPVEWLYWLPLFFLVASLYASVGHGGASGYLAVMVLMGIASEVMRPTALTLNLTVSLAGTILFFRAGHFAWNRFWPFAVVSIPFAYIGGSMAVSPQIFNVLLAIALAVAAGRLVFTSAEAPTLRQPGIPTIVLTGASIGWVSGLIGVGGGIFLTPLLLFFRWADPRTAAAVSAPFIFVNSAAGLFGHRELIHHLPAFWPILAITVLTGGIIGARWGSRAARMPQIKIVLALVLTVALGKLLLLD